MLPEAEPPTAGQSKLCKIMSWTQAKPQRNWNTWFYSKKAQRSFQNTLLLHHFIPRGVLSLGIEVRFSSMSGHEDTGTGVTY